MDEPEPPRYRAGAAGPALVDRAARRCSTSSRQLLATSPRLRRVPRRQPDEVVTARPRAACARWSTIASRSPADRGQDAEWPAATAERGAVRGDRPACSGARATPVATLLSAYQLGGPGRLAAHVAAALGRPARARRARRARRGGVLLRRPAVLGLGRRLPVRAGRGGRGPGAAPATSWSSCCCPTAGHAPRCGPRRLRAGWPLPATAAVVLVEPATDRPRRLPGWTSCLLVRRPRPARRDRAGPGARRAGASGWPRRCAAVGRGRPTVPLEHLPASARIAEVAARLQQAGVLADDPRLRRRAPRRDHRAPGPAAAGGAAAAGASRRWTSCTGRRANRSRETLRVLAAAHGRPAGRSRPTCTSTRRPCATGWAGCTSCSGGAGRPERRGSG